MPWKNGLGSTAQIAIFPEGAAFPGEDFLWRLSTATVRADSPFSLFPGCDRLLTVYQGDGLLLNGRKHEPLSPWAFSGDDPVESELLGSEVVDLGLIYRRGKVRATMVVKELLSSESVPLVPEGVLLIFCVQGQAMANGVLLMAGETLYVEGESQVELTSAPGAKYIEVSLQIL